VTGLVLNDYSGSSGVGGLLRFRRNFVGLRLGNNTVSGDPSQRFPIKR